jgi:hypothetical protein
MIRRDYVLRQVQELAQAVARVIFLRTRRDYEAALGEVSRALQQWQQSEENQSPSRTGETSNPLTPDDWIELCRRNEVVTGNLLVTVGNLIREQALVLSDLGRTAEASNAFLTALTLQLEAVLSGAAAVTRELVDGIDELIELTAEVSAPAGTLSRLASYLEQRRRLAQAEDALFEWMETGAPEAVAACRAFYGRLLNCSDEELAEGELPRTEVLEGLADLEARPAQAR